MIKFSMSQMRFQFSFHKINVKSCFLSKFIKTRNQGKSTAIDESITSSAANFSTAVNGVCSGTLNLWETQNKMILTTVQIRLQRKYSIHDFNHPISERVQHKFIVYRMHCLRSKYIIQKTGCVKWVIKELITCFFHFVVNAVTSADLEKTHFKL